MKMKMKRGLAIIIARLQEWSVHVCVKLRCLIVKQVVEFCKEIIIMIGMVGSNKKG
jgi:hypothetical protein